MTAAVCQAFEDAKAIALKAVQEEGCVPFQSVKQFFEVAEAVQVEDLDPSSREDFRMLAKGMFDSLGQKHDPNIDEELKRYKNTYQLVGGK